MNATPAHAKPPMALAPESNNQTQASTEYSTQISKQHRHTHNCSCHGFQPNH
eukprot:m.505946 g.505946  ORF g.505946 m.505946 type:complete len:52 (+) comp80332_c0_seq1:149-304(+)